MNLTNNNIRLYWHLAHTDERMPVVRNVFDWLQSAFVDSE